MEKKELDNEKDSRNQKIEVKRQKTPSASKKKKDKSLPWWVELLFIQIGLPDKFLITILKAKKTFKEIIKTDKKQLLTYLFVVTLLAYLYPVVKQSKHKLDCEATARNYIFKKKNLSNINRKEVRMLSTNFCNGGDEIYEIENIK